MNESKAFVGIRGYILKGKENGIHMGELASIMHCTERKLRQMVNVQRRIDQEEDYPYVLIGDMNGYYYSDNASDINRQMCISLKRGKTSFKMAKSTRRDLFDGQMRLKLDEEC